MINWIDELANQWGHWMRKSESIGGNVHGSLGRIMDEGLDGAAIREYGQKIPVVDFPKDVKKFHRGWLALEPHYQNLVFVDYRIRAKVTDKFDVMNLKKNAYYRRRGQALEKIKEHMALN